MKSKYLLSALAIGASFAACSNEDIMVNETIATNEVVGAKLLGTGLSLNISNGDGTESRATENGWEAGKDVAGLGWVVKGAPANFQTGVKIDEVGETLYSNHFYQYTEEGWNTKSNIYEGWHFAYLQYVHQAKPGKLTFNVNERAYAGGSWRADIYNNAPHISAAAFLSDDNVDTKNGTITESYSVQRIVNALYPTIDVSEDFTGDELLKEIALKSITVGVTDKNMFYTSVEVNPSALPVNQYNEDGEYDDVETLKQFNNGLYAAGGALKVTDNVKSITTTLAEGFKLDEKEQQLRIFLAPTRNQYMNKANLYFRVDVAGGHFDVKYTDPESLEEGQELTDIQEKNNEAIDKMYALLRNGWTNDGVTYKFTELYTTDKEGNVKQNNAQSLELGLGLENFTADYMVNDITDWNGCVALANALGEENPVFTLYTKDGKAAEVVFDGEDILAPANGVKVVGEGQLVVASDLTWNNDVVVERSEQHVSIRVDENAQLSVVGGTLAPYRLYNNGTILADATSTIGAKGYNSLYSNNRIVIEYGAYVYPRVNYKGVIAYEVPADYSFDKIATLIRTDNNAGQANVNTLIIGEGVSLNCVKTTVGEDTEGDDDRYNPTQGTHGTTTKNVLDLKDVNLEINGGSIFTEEGKEVTVYDVVMNGGDMTNVDINGDVDIEAGTNTINNAVIGKSVTVEAGSVTLNDVNITGELVNKGTATINGEGTIEIADIINYGTLNANTDVVVTTIAVNSGSKATVAEDYTIWYTKPQIDGGYIQEGTTTGRILFYGTGQFLNDLKAAEDGATVTLNSDVELSEVLEITENVTIDLNGKTITFGSVPVSRSSDSKYGIKNSGNMILKNGSIIAKGLTAVIRNEGVLDLVSVDIEADGRCVVSVGKWTDGKTIDELRNSRSVYTNIIGGTYKSEVKDGHSSHEYAIFGMDNSLTKITDATIEGDGGVGFECADGDLKNVKAKSKCNSAYGAYIYDAGELIYDNKCDLGTVFAQKYNKNGEYKDKYGKLFVNNEEINQSNTTSGAFGGKLWE